MLFELTKLAWREENKRSLLILRATDSLKCLFRKWLNAPDYLELLNVFVHRDFMRTKGIGRSLLAAVVEEAKAARAIGLLVNSGPRYLSSWGFYDRIFDADHGMLVDYYGTGRHAKVWSKLL